MDLWIHRISGNSCRQHGQSLALCGFKVGLLCLPLSELGAELLHGYRYWVQAGDQISGDWTLVKLVGKDAEGSHSWYEWCEQVRSICLSRFRAGFIGVLIRTWRTPESELTLNSSLSVSNKDSTAELNSDIDPD
jgi:hypothetical protein